MTIDEKKPQQPWRNFSSPQNLFQVYEKFWTPRRRFFLIYDCEGETGYDCCGNWIALSDLALPIELLPPYCAIFAKDFTFFVENFETRYAPKPKFKELMELDIPPMEWIDRFNTTWYKN